MNPEVLKAWAEAAFILISRGEATVTLLRAMFAAGGLPEEQLDAILDNIIANSRMRKAKSKAIADGT